MFSWLVAVGLLAPESLQICFSKKRGAQIQMRPLPRSFPQNPPGGKTPPPVKKYACPSQLQKDFGSPPDSQNPSAPQEASKTPSCRRFFVFLFWGAGRGEGLLWMDELLHHLRDPGRMIPLQIPRNNSFNHGFIRWFERISSIHSRYPMSGAVQCWIHL